MAFHCWVTFASNFGLILISVCNPNVPEVNQMETQAKPKGESVISPHCSIDSFITLPNLDFLSAGYIVLLKSQVHPGRRVAVHFLISSSLFLGCSEAKKQ